MQLIALDIDGTLLSSRFTVSTRNRAAIAEATRRGMIALVTGRRYDNHARCAADRIPAHHDRQQRRARPHQTRRNPRPPPPARDTALRVLQATEPWREATSVVFDRPLANQVMMETIDLEDGIRGAYYKWNKTFLGEAKPLETCLTEDPIQICFPARPAHASSRAGPSRRPIHRQFALAVTAYEARIFR